MEFFDDVLSFSQEKGVFLNETLASGWLRQDQHIHQRSPMMERLGLIVLLTGSLCAMDVVTVLVWQVERNSVSRRRQESVAITTPGISKTINVCEARTGEKVNSEEMWKRKSQRGARVR